MLNASMKPKRSSRYHETKPGGGLRLAWTKMAFGHPGAMVRRLVMRPTETTTRRGAEDVYAWIDDDGPSPPKQVRRLVTIPTDDEEEQRMCTHGSMMTDHLLQNR